MIRRVFRIKIFLGSTTEKINQEVETFLEKENICVGNFIDQQLNKLGGVYQFVLVYAIVKEEKD